MRSISFFVAASFFNGACWWSLLLADGSGVMEIVQLGGTGGLIVALLGAVVTLWKERTALETRWQSEVDSLRKMISEERDSHRLEIASLRDSHRLDIETISNKYTTELREQISRLREEANRDLEASIEEERRKSEERYRQKNGD